MFDFESLYKDDYDIAMQYLGEERKPDIIIAPDGHPYLYRWYLKPRSYDVGNLYLHIQVADDPERPMHDHPWDNMSVILAGGYIESLALRDVQGRVCPDLIRNVERKQGDTIFRAADDAHHLRLKPGELYSMSQFATGPKVREWGFHTPDAGWVPANSVIENLADGRSVYIGPRREA